MKVIYNQSEENGVFTVKMQTTLKNVTFGSKVVLEPNRDGTRKRTNEEAIAECIKDFALRYRYEQNRIEDKTNY